MTVAVETGSRNGATIAKCCEVDSDFAAIAGAKQCIYLENLYCMLALIELEALALRLS